MGSSVSRSLSAAHTTPDPDPATTTTTRAAAAAAAAAMSDSEQHARRASSFGELSSQPLALHPSVHSQVPTAARKLLVMLKQRVAELERAAEGACPRPSTVRDVLRAKYPNPAVPTAAALVNGELRALHSAYREGSRVEPVPLSSAEGMGVYRQSLCLLLAAACRDLFPERGALRVEHGFGLESSTLSRAYYCELSDGAIAEDEVAVLDERMRQMTAEDVQVREEYLETADAVAHFQASGQGYQSEFLLSRSTARSAVLRLGDFWTLSHSDRGRVVLPSTGLLTEYRVRPHDRGVALVFPTWDAGAGRLRLHPFSPLRNVSETYVQINGWAAAVGMASAGQLNAMIAAGGAENAVSLCEAVHETRIVEIAQQVANRRDSVRLVLIGGPSSSGKTTFAGRLRRQLTVRGFCPMTLSSDDYYRKRDEHYPRTAAGELNHEVIDALDLELFNRHLVALMAGEEVDTPIFDFATERRSAKSRRLRLPANGVLIVEGIFCLNNRLTEQVDAARKYRIYIAPMSQLNIDELHFSSNQLTRLIRRICRDFRHRNRDAKATIAKWSTVRSGEEENLFPHIGNADTVFNSALDYELAVLKVYVQPLLENVRPHDKEYTVARQLLGLCARFHPIPAVHVPTSSLLQEFLGHRE